MTDYKALLSNLLAVIHRDGGQYERDHHTETAVNDAIEIVSKEWQLKENFSEIKEHAEYIKSYMLSVSYDAYTYHTKAMTSLDEIINLCNIGIVIQEGLP